MAVAVALSDAVIRRYLADGVVHELRDLRHPLRLRYHANRRTASLFLVLYRGGRGHWTKIGNWPALTVKAALGQLPALIAQHSAGERNPLDQWQQVTDLLTWYRDRALADRNLSPSRKSNIKWAINRHLLPRLGNERLTELDHSLLDTELVWPLQQQLALSTVRQLFGALKAAFRRAHKLRKLAADPLAALLFSDFIEAEIKPRQARLHAGQLPELLAAMATQPAPARTMLWLMLAHGWRRNETRLLRWSWLDTASARLTIPGEATKTGEALTAPITTEAAERLQSYRRWQTATGYRGPYLFPSGQRRGPISESTADQWVATASQRQWSAHDLRKLARTGWADQGTDYLVAERLLNHALARLDQAYIHTTVEAQKRTALETWHHTLKQAETGTKTAARSSILSCQAEPAPALE